MIIIMSGFGSSQERKEEYKYLNKCLQTESEFHKLNIAKIQCLHWACINFLHKKSYIKKATFSGIKNEVLIQKGGGDFS